MQNPCDANALNKTEEKSVVPDSSINNEFPSGNPWCNRILSKSELPVDVVGCEVTNDGLTPGFCMIWVALSFSIDLGLDFNWNDEVVVVVIPLPVTAGGVLPNGGARPAIPGALAGIEAMGPLFGADFHLLFHLFSK